MFGALKFGLPESARASCAASAHECQASGACLAPEFAWDEPGSREDFARSRRARRRTTGRNSRRRNEEIAESATRGGVSTSELRARPSRDIAWPLQRLVIIP